MEGLLFAINLSGKKNRKIRKKEKHEQIQIIQRNKTNMKKKKKEIIYIYKIIMHRNKKE